MYKAPMVRERPKLGDSITGRVLRTMSMLSLVGFPLAIWLMVSGNKGLSVGMNTLFVLVSLMVILGATSIALGIVWMIAVPHERRPSLKFLLWFFPMFYVLFTLLLSTFWPA